MQTSVTRPTIPIGISRSVIGNVSALPALRAREAAIALARPLATGFTNFSSVQIAETPIAPAFDVRSVLGIAATANLEHLGTGHALRIRQIRSSHQRPPKWN